MSTPPLPPLESRWGLPWLLAQVGAHAAGEFAKRIAPLSLTAPDAGILHLLGRSAGMSQRQLAQALHMHASRLVAIIDALESRGLVARGENANDRRSHALRITEKGQKTLAEIGRAARAHSESLCAALNEAEQAQLYALLQRIADAQGLTRGVHPGYSRLRPGKSPSGPSGNMGR
jgi:DNA-binding MarR family transcriptional regulator